MGLRWVLVGGGGGGGPNGSSRHHVGGVGQLIAQIKRCLRLLLLMLTLLIRLLLMLRLQRQGLTDPGDAPANRIRNSIGFDVASSQLERYYRVHTLLIGAAFTLPLK